MRKQPKISHFRIHQRGPGPAPASCRSQVSGDDPICCDKIDKMSDKILISYLISGDLGQVRDEWHQWPQPVWGDGPGWCRDAPPPGAWLQLRSPGDSSDIDNDNDANDNNNDRCGSSLPAERQDLSCPGSMVRWVTLMLAENECYRTNC